MSTTDPVNLFAHHLLLLDAQSGFSDVLALLGNLDPRLAPAGPGSGGRVVREELAIAGTPAPVRVERAKLARHSAVAGPVDLSAESARALGVPDWAERAVVLFTPRDREPAAPPDWYRDADGRWRLFPAGLPEREEGRNLDMLIAVARRLQTGLRLADEPGLETGRLLVPDYGQAHDLTVYSSLWLAPELLLERVRVVEPGAQFPSEVAAGLGGPAAAADAAPMLDGYAIEIPLRRDGRDIGEIELGVYVEEYPPALLVDLTERAHAATGHPAADLAETVERDEDSGDALAFVGYQLRWIDPEFGSDTRREAPAFEADRAFAGRRIDRLAAAIVRAGDGVVFDSDGFLVAEHQLG